MLKPITTFCAMLVLAAAAFGAAPASAATLFTLDGHGWGHGIGMSQWGAYGYASHGWTHTQILEHYFTGTTVGTLPGASTERVLLVSSRPSLHITLGSSATGADGGGSARQLAAGSYRVDPGPVAGNLRLWSVASGAYVWKAIAAPLRITPASKPLRLDDTSVNGFGGDHWWGDFQIGRHGGSLSLIDLVGTEKYVQSVVPCEVSASWPAQALQTQAVASRSYAVATRNPSAGYDAVAGTSSQMYCPVEHNATASNAATTATRRQVVLHSGQVATTFFSASSGGRTSSISASWGGSDQPYLVPVNDRFDGAGGLNPNHTWAPKRYTRAGLAAALGLGHPVGSVDLTVDGPSQRVLSVDAHTSAGTATLSAGTVFARLGLRSTYFRILQLSLSAPSSVDRGASFTLRGRVWPAGAVRLQAKHPGHGWTTSDVKLQLDSDGRFALARSPSTDVSYRLSRRHAFSPVVHVAVVAQGAVAISAGTIPV